MTASPLVQVQFSSDPSNWHDTPGGVDIVPGDTVSICLADTLGVGSWYLSVVGVDEVTATPPVLVNVSTDPDTKGLVVSPTSIVSFTSALGNGRAFIFKSSVNGQSITTTFGIFVRTSGGFRVGAVGERFEGDPVFGWTGTINQFIRSGGGGGGPASALQTTTGNVDVSGAAAPTPGEVLTAVDSTHATWQPGGGGGTPTGPAGGDLGGTYPKPEVIGIEGNQVVSSGGSVDLNLPLGADLLPGEVLGPIPGSGNPQKLILLTQYDFVAIREASIVVVNVNHSDPTIFTSTPINLNNATSSLDLNLVTILNGAYDGSRYVWFVGDYNGTSFYLWGVDSTLINPVVVYQLTLTLPSFISELRSITYADGMVIVGVLDGNDSKSKLLKINPTNGSTISVTPFAPQTIVTGPTVVGTITAGNTPKFAAWDGSGHVYISNTFDTTLTRISVATGLADLTISLASSPMGLAWGGGAYMYVAGSAGVVYKIDISTGSVTGSPITVGSNPFGIAWDGGTHMYVSNSGATSVSIIDITTDSVSTISVGITPYGVAWDGGLYVWVAGFSSNSIVRIEVSSGTVFDTIPMTGAPFGGFPMFIAWDHLTHMYATDVNGYVYQMAVSDGTIDNTIGLSFQPNTGITWDGGTHMWVAVFQNDTVVTIDTSLVAVDHTVSVAAFSSPYGIAWDGSTHVYTANQESNDSTRLSFGGSVITALAPDTNSATSDSDYSWYGGFVASTTQSRLSRFNPSSLVHRTNDTSNIETHPISTDLASVQILLNSLKVNYTAHLDQAGVHIVDDTDPNSSVASLADATDSITPVTFPLCAALANNLKLKFNAHRTQVGVHANDDTVNIITTPDATASSLSSIITLANDIGYAVGFVTLHGKYNAHLSQKVGGFPVHVVDDWVNTETEPQATDLTTLKNLLQDLALFYGLHIQSAIFHVTPDTVNVITASTNLDADVGQYQTSTNLANGLKAALNYHFLKAGIHYYYDQNLITTPNADNSSYTDLSGVVALANALGYASTHGAYNNHLSRTRSIVHELLVSDGYVSYGDLTGSPTSFLLSITEFTLNAFQTQFNAHLVYPGVHQVNDTTNLSTAAQATDTPAVWWPTASALVNDIKTQFNAHASNNGGAYHSIIDSSNIVTVPDSTADDLLSIISLTNALGYAIGYGSYNQHRTSATIGITVGFHPFSIAWDGANHMYVGNSSDGTVSVINITTHAIDATTTVGAGPFAVAWDGGSYMYVCNASDGTVSRVDVSTFLVFDTTTVGTFPSGVVKCGTNMYVCNAGDSTLSVIDIATGIPGSPITMTDVGTDLIAITSFDSNYVYLCDHNNNTVIKVNVNTSVQHTLSVGLSPTAILLDGGSYLYVVNYGDGSTASTVTRIATDSFTVFGSPINVGVAPSGVAWDGGSSPGFMYVTNWGDSTVSRIDIGTGLVTSTINMGSGLGPLAIAWDDGSYLWATETNPIPGVVARISVTSGTLVSTVNFIHQANDQDNVEAFPYDGSGVISATTLANVQARLFDLAGQYMNHISDIGPGAPYHFVTDITNVITAAPPTDVAPTFPTTYDLATELKAKFNAHLTQTGVHINNDTTSTVTNTQNENIKAFPAPDPADNADLTAIINIVRALATFGYYGAPASTANINNGAYDFHLTQPLEFLDTNLTLTSGATIEVLSYLSADLYSVAVMAQDSSGVPYFYVVVAQDIDGGTNNPHIPGYLNFTWNFSAVFPQCLFPRRFTVGRGDGDLWFIAGGVPDETTLPYTINRTPNFYFGTPTPPNTDLNVAIPTGLIPTDIAWRGAIQPPIRVSYGLGDYVGDLDDTTGARDQIAKYPMGGALGFSPLPPSSLSVQVNGSPVAGKADTLNITGVNILYFPTMSPPGTFNIPIPPAGTWSATGNIGVDEILPSEIAPGHNTIFRQSGTGSVLYIDTGVANVKAVALTDIVTSSPDLTISKWDGVTINSGDRVLLNRQITLTENGLYIYFDPFFYRTLDPVVTGSEVYVEQGEIFGGRTFQQQTLGTITPTVTQEIWKAEDGPHIVPPLTQYNGSGGVITWNTIDTVPGPNTNGYDLIIVVDNVATKSDGTIQRERGATTYRQASGVLTLSDDSRSLSATNYFKQVISLPDVQLQVGQQAAGSNYTFRVRAWYEYVRAV